MRTNSASYVLSRKVLTSVTRPGRELSLVDGPLIQPFNAFDHFAMGEQRCQFDFARSFEALHTLTASSG